MPIEIVWDNDERSILRYDVSGKWNWDELFQARDKVFAQMDSASAERIDAIINFVGGLSVPNDALGQIQKLREDPHAKAGLTVMVGTNMFLRTLLSTATKVYNAATGHTVEFMYAKSLEEARQFIAQDRIRS
jgi:hypothetical protein